jgi:hypothetical protein
MQLANGEWLTTQSASLSFPDQRMIAFDACDPPLAGGGLFLVISSISS